ncbi:MAG: acyltransferase [Devosia sp.]
MAPGSTADHLTQTSLASLQFVRFAAAFAVVFCHSLEIYRHAGGDNESFAAIARHGALGVPVFFVISGFVIYGAALRASSAAIFTRRRFGRIYPPLWAAVLLFLIVSWALGGSPVSPANIFRSLTLLDLDPTGDRNALFVAWTLSFEMLFYLTAAALLLLPLPARLPGAIAVLATSIVLVYSGWPWVPPLLANPLIFSFVFGVAAARARISVPLRLPVGGLGLAMWGLGLWMNFDTYPTYSTLLFGGGTALVFAAGKYWDITGGAAAIFRFAGDMSYALYLTHPAILAAFQLTGTQRQLASSISPLGMVAVYCAAALLCGLLFHLVIERGVIGMTRRGWPAAAKPAGA